MRSLSRLRRDFLEWYDEQPELVRDLIDQLGHFALFGLVATGIPGLVARVWLEPLIAACAAAAVGTVSFGLYELIQNVGDSDNDYGDLAVDLVVEAGSVALVATLVAVL